MRVLYKEWCTEEHLTIKEIKEIQYIQDAYKVYVDNHCSELIAIGPSLFKLVDEDNKHWIIQLSSEEANIKELLLFMNKEGYLDLSKYNSAIREHSYAIMIKEHYEKYYGDEQDRLDDLSCEGLIIEDLDD